MYKNRISDFISYMEEAGVTEIQKLKIGTREDRVYFTAVFPNNEHVFVKFQLDEEGIRKIQNERVILQALNKKLYRVPKYPDDNYIISEYLEGYVTLKDIILDNMKNGNKEIIGDYVVHTFEQFIDILAKVSKSDLLLETEDWSRKFRMHFNKLLMSSGWWGQPNWRLIIRETIVGYLGFIVALPFKYKLIKPVESITISHGDFHWGNVMCKNEDVRIIDVENIMHGDPNMDIAYFYSRLWFYFKNDKELMNYLDKGLSCFKNSPFYEEKAFNLLLRIFKFLIRCNPKFK